MKIKLHYFIIVLILCLFAGITACENSGDVDEDGYTVEQGDCNDDDAAVNPGADDICGDEIDQDCNGTVDDPCSPVYINGQVGSYGSIQAGIDAAAEDDTVVVRDGTYFENINFEGKAITVKSEDGAATTMIDGDNIDVVVTFNSREESTSTLDGFTVTNGTSSGWGAGVYIQNSNPTIKNCIIRENSTKIGAGLYVISSSPTIIDCTILNNTASNKGGGLWSRLSTFTIDNCTFTGNTASNNGGGAYLDASTVTISNSVFTGNSAGRPGGGIYCNGSTTILTDNTVSSNEPDNVFGCE